MATFCGRIDMEVESGVGCIGRIGEESDGVDIELGQVRGYSRNRSVKITCNHDPVLHLYVIAIYGKGEVMDRLPGYACAGVYGCLLFERGNAGCPGDGAVVGDQFYVHELTGNDIGIGVTEIDLLKGRSPKTGADRSAQVQIIE